MPDKAFPALVNLTSTQIADVAQSAGEPAWLVDRRVEAWNFFVQAIPPEWRRTDLTQLHPEDIVPSSVPQGTALQWDESFASHGIVFTTLANAVREYESLVRDKLGRAIDPLRHKFSALRSALWQDGVFLYVPKDVKLDLPLRVCYTLADGSMSIFPYSLVLLEPGAQVTFIEEMTSYDAPEIALAAPTTEMFLGEGSMLRYISLQQWGAHVYHIGGQAQVFDSNANSAWVTVTMGGQVQHVEAEAWMQGDGCSVNWVGGTIARKQQHALIAPSVYHKGAHTESHLDFKTVVMDEGYSVFDGMVKIEHDSRDTITRLEEHAIHLTPKARSDSIPGLKIDTNNVTSAGHASTSGQVEEEQLFYMQSRGISRDEAIRVIVMGFFEPVLDAIPLDELRETLAVAIEASI